MADMVCGHPGGGNGAAAAAAAALDPALLDRGGRVGATRSVECPRPHVEVDGGRSRRQ